MKTVGITAKLIGDQILQHASVSADTEAEAVEAAECISADPEMRCELWRPAS